jgi:hypothetical protein
VPQARVDGWRSFAFDELEIVEIDQHIAAVVQNLTFGPCDQSSLGVFEVLLIFKFEFLCQWP